MACRRCKAEFVVCHVCPNLLYKGKPSGDVMPGCWNGAIYNELDGCLCDIHERWADAIMIRSARQRDDPSLVR